MGTVTAAMTSLHRARLACAAALLSAVVIIGVEFPFGEILHQRSELHLVDGQLASIQARNASLQADITALSQSATISAIAHEDYGLVKPGQQSYVILPAASAAVQGAALQAPAIPPQDLVAAPPGSATLPPPVASSDGGGFWSRFFDRLEFWR